MKEKIKHSLFVLTVALALSACSKEQDKSPIPVDKDSDTKTLTIRVSGVANIQNETGPLRSGASGDNYRRSATLRKKAIEQREGFDVQTTTTEDINDHDAFAQNRNDSKIRASLANKAASSVVANDVKYRVVLYTLATDDTETFHSSHLFTGAEDQQIMIQENENYKWYAYSYNSDVEPADISSEESPTVAVENVDFIYANGSVSLTEEENSTINIEFKRKTSKVSVEIDARGMFAEKISQLQVDILPDFLYGATFDIKTGRPLSTDTFTPTELTLNDFTKGDEVLTGFEGIVRKEFYTAKENSISGEVFTLKSFTVEEIADDASRSLSFATANAIQSVDETNNISGNSYRFRVNLIQSPLYMTISGGSIAFARGNLYDRDNSLRSGETNHGRRYAFRNQGYDGLTPNQQNKDLFSFNNSVAGNVLADGVDPCTKVYPEGTWKTTDNSALLQLHNSLKEYQRASLFNSMTINYRINGTKLPYLPYTTTTKNPLCLQYGGYMEDNGDGTFAEIENLYTARYVSSEPYSILVIYYTFTQTQRPGSTVVLNRPNDWQSIPNQLRSVRCIRSN